MQLRVWGLWAALIVGAVLLARPALADHDNTETEVPGLGEVIYHEGDVEVFGKGPDVITLGVGAFELFKQDPLSAEGRLEYRWGQKLFFIGPMVGVMANTDGGVHGYIGGYFDFRVGNLTVTPSAGPGLWREGGSKDLGGTFQFHTALDFSYVFEGGSRLGVKLSHISSAHINEKNPGSESLTLTYTLPVGNMF